MNGYGENISEFQNSMNKDDMFLIDPKLHENDYRNGSIELRGESAFISCETGKPNENAATNNFEIYTSNFQSALADSEKNYLQMKNSMKKQVLKSWKISMEVIVSVILN